MAKRSVRSKTSKKKTKVTVEVVRQMLTLATSGFGLVAALAWNSFIQELVNSYVKKFLPTNSGLASLFLYAVIVTVLAVIVTLNLSRFLEEIDH